MNPYFPDDSGMRRPVVDASRERHGAPPQPHQQGQQQNRRPGFVPPFFPGDQNAIAEQLSMGFGGDQQKYMQMLRQIYSPVRMGFNPGQGGGGGMGGGMGQPDPQLLPGGLTPGGGMGVPSPVGRSR